VAENHEYDPVSEAKCGWEPRGDGCDSRKNQLGWHAIGSGTMEQPRMAEHLTSRCSPSGESVRGAVLLCLRTAAADCLRRSILNPLPFPRLDPFPVPAKLSFSKDP
jgi:hypothetical protein